MDIFTPAYANALDSKSLSVPLKKLESSSELSRSIYDAKLLDDLAAQLDSFKSRFNNEELRETIYVTEHHLDDLVVGETYIGNLTYPNSDYIHVLVKSEGDSWHSFSQGDEQAYDLREHGYRLPSFKLIKGNTNPIVVIQVLDTLEPDLFLILRASQDFAEYAQNDYLYYGFYFGLLALLAIGSLLLIIFTRDISFLWYACYLASAIVFLGTSNGLWQSIVWKAASGTTDISFVAGGGMALFLTLFAISFLTIRRTDYPWFRYVSITTLSIITACCVALLFVHHGKIDILFFVAIAIQMVAVFAVSVRIYQSKKGLALYLVLGYLVLFPILLFAVLKFAGYIDASTITTPIIEVAFLCEALILSWGLGKKIQQYTRIRRRTTEQISRGRAKYLNDLISAREHEKKEIGIALHNSVAQMLALLRGKLVNIDKANEQISLSELVDLTDYSIEKVRQISHSSYPHILEQFGLSHAIKQYAETHLDANEIDWKASIADLDLENREQLLLYRISQELINNIVRHANASYVTIDLMKTKSGLKLSVQDDGKGFDQSNKGFGLLTIREYSESLGGQMEISSEPNVGSIISVSM